MRVGHAVLVFLLSPLLRAQCANEWLPGQTTYGADGPVTASTWWDPDGSGPATPVLVLGGAFDVLGDAAANRIGAFDPATGSWSTFGAGINGRVLALGTLPNGDLVAGGSFTEAGGTTAYGIARWDGASWHPLGSGFPVVPPYSHSYVYALAVMPNGDLVAGGIFGGSQGEGISRWDGNSWQPLGSGMSGGVPSRPFVTALATLPNGDLVAGGQFTSAGGVSTGGLARWDGSAWSAVGGLTPGYLYDVEVLANGDLVIADGSSVQRWDGVQWTTLGATLPWVATLLQLANGDLVAGLGNSSWNPSVPSSGAYRWNGANWVQLGGSHDRAIRALAELPGGDLVTAGFFSEVGGVLARGLARWGGSTWSAMAVGCDGLIAAIATLPDGDVVVAGDFTGIGGVAANHIARWDGARWHPLGSGIPFTPGWGAMYALTVLPNGDLVAGGAFQVAGGVPVVNVARWDGQAWHPMGAGLVGAVRAILVLPNGDVVAGGGATNGGGIGTSNLSRWDGTSWTSLGLGYTNGILCSLAHLPNGDLVAAGTFPIAGSVLVNRIVRWDGSSWSPLGGGADRKVAALAVLPNGDLVAAGFFTSPASRIARWDGNVWHPLGAGIGDGGVTALGQLPNGDLVVGGFFNDVGGVPMPKIARWDGNGWQALASELNRDIYAMAIRANGDLVVGGNFTVIDGGVRASFGVLSTTCPATVATVPTGCVGPAGPLTLVADTLPWTGATFRATATGFAPNSIPVSVVGLSPQATPLSQFFGASALPGCDLLVSAEGIAMLFGASDPVPYALPLPNDPFFAGLVLQHQFLQVGTNGLGQLASISSSNALALTIGAF